MRRIWYMVLTVVCAACMWGVLPSRQLAEELTLAEFHRLYEQLEPAPDALWRTIPWKIALLDAQRAAVRENKPLFIWAMDGHPLGCT